MDVSGVSGVRAAPYDRTPVTGALAYVNASTAPAGWGEVIAVTVPVNRKMLIASMSLQVLRQSAAAPMGMASLDVLITPSGLAQVRVLHCPLFDNAVNASNEIQLLPDFVLGAGDELHIYKVDASSGGTLLFAASIPYVLFDA